MNYHNITTDDMLNGSGLRVCLWCSGCSHHCEKCQNPQTWDKNSGIDFDLDAENELFALLANDYISGVTFTGGDPLHENNLDTVYELCSRIKKEYNQKNIWLYTGYTWEQIFKDISTHESSMRRQIINLCDVIVDGRFEEHKKDMNYPWAGSTNQRVIDVQKSVETNSIVLWENK